jgi:hypothetical protein
MLRSAVIDEKAKTLTITLDYDPAGAPSASGKTRVHASTHGNAATTAQVAGKVLVVGVNAYTK